MNLSANVVQQSLLESTPALVKSIKAAMANGLFEALGMPQRVPFDPDVDYYSENGDSYTRFANCFYEIMKTTAKEMLVDIINNQ